jgi:hypothetical protein
LTRLPTGYFKEFFSNQEFLSLPTAATDARRPLLGMPTLFAASRNKRQAAISIIAGRIVRKETPITARAAKMALAARRPHRCSI